MLFQRSSLEVIIISLFCLNVERLEIAQLISRCEEIHQAAEIRKYNPSHRTARYQGKSCFIVSDIRLSTYHGLLLQTRPPQNRAN
jgi:hypothetical protein